MATYNTCRLVKKRLKTDLDLPFGFVSLMIFKMCFEFIDFSDTQTGPKRSRDYKKVKIGPKRFKKIIQRFKQVQINPKWVQIGSGFKR